METEERNSFLGTGWSFPPDFSKASGTVKMISDEEDIASSLEVLLLTAVGERIMQPDYGCNLDVLLFESITVGLETYIKDLVFRAVYYFEPRVTPMNVTLKASPEKGMVLVQLDYVVRSTNSRYNLVFPYYTNEGTN